MLPPNQHVGKVTVFNLIEKLKRSEQSDTQGTQSLRRPSVQSLASKSGSRYVAFPGFSTCLLCSSRLTWMDSFRRPFFFPEQGTPERGILHEKYCKSCNTLFSVSYYCPEGSDERRPYPADADSLDWLELSGDTVLDMQLLRQHDNDL